jgi:hypothetical protein
VQLDFEAFEERNYYTQKTTELQGLLKSCALELIEHENLLSQTTQADDVAAEIDDLHSQIETVATDQEKVAKIIGGKEVAKDVEFLDIQGKPKGEKESQFDSRKGD